MIIISSSNQGKIKEFKDILGHKFDIVSKKEYGLGNIDVEETGSTLKENAFLKAKSLFELTKKKVISDDTGLFIEGLDNRPGVYSRRYAGEHATFDDNINKVLKELSGIENRKAVFRAVICYINENGQVKYFSGECKGKIAMEKRGNLGFGYDPIFIPDGYDKTWGEMGEEEKNRMSHRKKALKKLEEYFNESASGL